MPALLNPTPTTTPVISRNVLSRPSGSVTGCRTRAAPIPAAVAASGPGSRSSVPISPSGFSTMVPSPLLMR